MMSDSLEQRASPVQNNLKTQAYSIFLLDGVMSMQPVVAIQIPPVRCAHARNHWPPPTAKLGRWGPMAPQRYRDRGATGGSAAQRPSRRGRRNDASSRGAAGRKDRPTSRRVFAKGMDGCTIDEAAYTKTCCVRQSVALLRWKFRWSAYWALITSTMCGKAAYSNT